MSPSGLPPRTRLKTRDIIVDVAERLWGERGLDGASLREISAAAGLSNPASVQYHFGGKDALINAIFNRRLPVIDQQRGELIAAAQARGESGDVQLLLDCLFRPLFDQRDDRGFRSYAAFLRQVLQDKPAVELRGEVMEMTPATNRLLDMLRAAMPDMPASLAMFRIMSINLMMLHAIDQLDRDPPEGVSPDLAYRDTLAMLAAAIVQPLER